MFKTIFSKLVVIFIAILLLGYSIAGITLFYFLDNYVSDEQVKLMEQKVDNISNQLNIFLPYLQNKNTSLDAAMLLSRFINSTAGSSSYIWVVNSSGYIILPTADYMGIQQNIKSNMKTDDSGIKLPDEKQYKKITTGQTSELKEKGDFYGLYQNTPYTWLTIEKPFKYTLANSNKSSYLGILISTPISEITKTRTSVINFFIISVSVSSIISVVLIYVFSRRISKPLKQINEAARVIASGDFQKQLTIKSKDEIGELAESFNQMVADLRNLEEMRRDFVANVSHELRTPMTSIKGFIEGILDGTIPPDRQLNYLNVVRDEINRMNRLVNNLLDLAKIESGDIPLNFRVIDINELCRRCIIKLESLIVQKELEVEANFEDEEAFVVADPDAIERVIINLMHNAVKFSFNGGKIEINTKNMRNKVVVSVKDEGIGIDQDEIDMIWDRFYKSDKSRGKDKSGTGLGLAIVKNLVNGHGQEIWVESEPGKGTVFSFTLNAAPTPDDNE
ncbi:MAG: ATP-binding protein [Bacillota bacterium]|nr:ATP-binding protein [Bacillota bacterium]